MVRPVVAGDLGAVTRLLRDAGRRFYGVAGADLPALLEGSSGVALDVSGELWGLALAGWPVRQSAWLRALALADGVDTRPGVERLLPALHAALHARGVANIYYGGDEGVDDWLLPALGHIGYLPETEVVVYEKQSLEIPDGGSPAVRVRPVEPVDLAEVLRIDGACFESQWTKEGAVLEPALREGPFFVVAELEGRTVGYAYATTHFGGRLVHLVRIAVDPERRGERVGVRLLSEVVAFAQETGASTITLNTQAYNSNAQRLYRWFGFFATGERQVVLRRPLP